MNEKIAVEKELSSLIEVTLKLEEDLRSFIGMEE